ncbi:cytochrome P450 CYP72A219 [Helianthus annuus]|uniref:Putative cytochrome P450 n=1 Tax=Helianthus annuus TaxID=4232 RepID=A0A251RRF3_HELAN|nr:cytochrome P450 CYP72A219 [Helianthus annuus]
MEITSQYKWVASWCGVAMVMLVPWKMLEWTWLKPKRLEKYLRQQGLTGTTYKLPFGDTKEIMNTTQLEPMNLSDDIMPRVMPFVHRAIQIYGKIFFSWFGPVPTLHIIDPDVVRDVLSRMNEFQKPKKNNPYIEILSTGVIDYEGDKWSKHRKIINPTFHAEKLKLMVPAMCLSCHEMIKRWETSFSDEQSFELDVFPHLQTLTGDVISRTAFGSSYEEGKKIFELQKEIGLLLMHVLQSLYIPGLRFLPNSRNKRMVEIDGELKGLIRSMIDKRMIAMEAGETGQDDLLGLLLQSNYDEIQKRGNQRYGMTIDEVIEECKLFYFAGNETVGNLLVWTMVLLSRYPQWQELARDEAFQVFGNNQPDIDGLSRLKIVTMILLEVLRLYPAVSALYRTSVDETKVAGVNIPEGTLIIMPILALHHDQDTWGDDALEFNPTRFALGVSKAASKGQLSYLPFGGGPRICIGQNFAMLEAKIALVMILQRFSFVLSPSYSHAPQSVITLQPQFGAHLILKKVEKS